MSNQSDPSPLDRNELPQIVEVLIKEPNLVVRWREFWLELDLDVVDLSFKQFQYNCGNLNPYELFINILTRWLLRKGPAATKDALWKTLRNMDMMLTAESLKKEFRPYLSYSNRQIWPLWFNVGKPIKHFVGRQRELNQLRDSYDNSDHKITLISGLGGIGKTELIKKFVQDFHGERKTSCTWFNCESEATINHSLITLAEKIGIKVEDSGGKIRNTPELFEDLVTSVISNVVSLSWLVIFDNVDDIHQDLIACLRLINEAENTFTIITSRNRSFAYEDWKLIELEEWETLDAVEFVKRTLNIETDEDDNAVNQLCGRLGNHPLATQQAVVYIIQQRRNSVKGESYSIRDYLQEFDTRGKKTGLLLNQKLCMISHKFAKTTFNTWDITLAKIKEVHGELGNLASSILHRIAYLDHDAISLDFIEQMTMVSDLSCLKYSEKMTEKAMTLLKAYSLIKLENCIISTHRLVQEVTRIKMKSSNEEFIVLENLTKLVQKLGPFPRSDLLQVLSIWKYASHYNNIIIKFPNTAIQISNRLHDFGLYSQMYIFTSKNYKTLKNVLGAHNTTTLAMQHDLARALEGTGNWEKSLEMYSQLWQKQKKILGEEHESTLATANNMAAVLFNLNKIEEAEKVWGKVLKSLKNTVGEYHPLTIITKHNLALWLGEKGQLDLSLAIFNQVLEWRLKELGDRHHQTLTTRHNIAVCLFHQGKYLVAKEQFEDIWKLSETILGEKHPHTLHSMYWLGVTHYCLSSREKSLELLEQALVLQKEVLGPNHPHTIETKKKICEAELAEATSKAENSLKMTPVCASKSVAFDKGQFNFENHIKELLNIFSGINYKETLIRHFSGIDKKELAKEFTSRTCEITQMHSLRHITKTAFARLAKLCYLDPKGIHLEFLKKFRNTAMPLQENIDELHSVSNAALNLSEETLPESLTLLKSYSLININDSEITVNPFFQKVIQFNLCSSNQESEFLSLLIEEMPALQSLSKCDIKHTINVWKYASNHMELIKKFPTVPVTISNLLYDLGMYPQQLTFINSTTNKLRDALGPNHMETIHMELTLAKALFANGQHKESLATFKDVWEKQKKYIGEDDTVTIATANNIVQVLSHLDRFDDAIELSNKVLNSNQPLDQNSTYTIIGKQQRATVYYRDGHFDLALQILEQVCEWQEREMSENHVQTLSTKHNIAVCMYKLKNYPEAKDRLKKVLTLRVKKIGEEHPDTLRSKFWLGRTIYEYKNITKGLKILQQVLEQERKVLGPTHPQTKETKDTIMDLKQSLLSGKSHSNLGHPPSMCNIDTHSNVEDFGGQLAPTNPKHVKKQLKNQLIVEASSESVETNLPNSYGLSKATKNFSGRESQLEQLRHYLNSNEDLILVCGIGGFGKTQLCRKFAIRYCQEFNASGTSRVWLHGESFETLRNSILGLGDKLGVKNEIGLNPSQFFNSLIYIILKASSRLLVFIDQVDQIFKEVRDVIRFLNIHEGLSIIVTSRDRSVLSYAGINLNLSTLQDFEAKFMLQECIKPLKNADADTLCKLFQNYPLALQQAIAYIKVKQMHFRTKKYSVSDYVKEFESKKHEMLDQKLNAFEHNYMLTTLVVWDMTLHGMNETALKLMKVLAYLHPDQILIAFLQNVFNKFQPEEDFDLGLGILHRYSFVQIEDDTIKIDRLVQEALRLKTSDAQFPKNLFESALLAWVEERQLKFSPVETHDQHQLNSICKFAHNCEVERYDKFEIVVLFLLKHLRLDCAVEYTKLCFENIKFSSKLDDSGKTDLIKKVALWNKINGVDNVNNYNVETGAYVKRDEALDQAKMKMLKQLNDLTIHSVEEFDNSKKKYPELTRDSKKPKSKNLFGLVFLVFCVYLVLMVFFWFPQ